MAYRHNDALYKHKVRAHRLRKAAIIAVGLTSLFALVVGVDWLLNQVSNSNTVVSRENTTSVQSANVSVYRTEYFQFQAPEEWVAVAGESSDKKFVFVKNSGTLITQKLTIYIDRPVDQRDGDLKLTNVIPVDVSELGMFMNVGEVSNHCDESWPSGLPRNPSRITHQTVSFVCAPSSKQYNVVIGQYGQDEDIEFTMSNGTKINIAMVYSDLTAYPSPGDIFNIISSFNIL